MGTCHTFRPPNSCGTEEGCHAIQDEQQTTIPYARYQPPNDPQTPKSEPPWGGGGGGVPGVINFTP